MQLEAVGYAAKAAVRLADTITGISEGVFQIFGNVGESITMKHGLS